MAPKPPMDGAPMRAPRLTTTEDEGFLLVSRLCEKAGLSKEYFYALVRQGRAPKPVTGVPLKQALLWLQARAAAAGAKAEAARAAAASIRGVSAAGEDLK
jgi:hypothetical protein